MGFSLVNFVVVAENEFPTDGKDYASLHQKPPAGNSFPDR